MIENRPHRLVLPTVSYLQYTERWAASIGAAMISKLETKSVSKWTSKTHDNNFSQCAIVDRASAARAERVRQNLQINCLVKTDDRGIASTDHAYTHCHVLHPRVSALSRRYWRHVCLFTSLKWWKVFFRGRGGWTLTYKWENNAFLGEPIN